jgi:hypothetical protein
VDSFAKVSAAALERSQLGVASASSVNVPRLTKLRHPGLGDGDENGIEAISRLTLHVSCQVRIEIGGHYDVGAAEPPLHDLPMHPFCPEEPHAGVPQVVQANNSYISLWPELDLHSALALVTRTVVTE